MKKSFDVYDGLIKEIDKDGKIWVSGRRVCSSFGNFKKNVEIMRFFKATGEKSLFCKKIYCGKELLECDLTSKEARLLGAKLWENWTEERKAIYSGNPVEYGEAYGFEREQATAMGSVLKGFVMAEEFKNNNNK